MCHRYRFLLRHSVVVAIAIWTAGCASVQSHETEPETTPRVAGASSSGSDDDTERLDRLRRTQRYVEYAAGGALVTTATLGLLVFGNQPTSFDDGRCITGNPHFGSYGCRSLSTVHGVLGVSSAVTYTTAGVMEWTLPNQPEGSADGPFQSLLTPAHVVGMALTPAIGIVGREPEVLGFESGPGAQAPRTIRTIHASVAITTVGLYIASYFVD